MSVDIEGATGVVAQKETSEGAYDYERARRYLTRDVNAAIEGALEGGATRIVLHDTHGLNYRNILFEDLHPAAELVKGMPILFFEGLKPEFDACLLIGMHSSPWTPGVLSHLFSSEFFRGVRVNGQPVGEGHVTAAMAGELGIPTVLVTGDNLTAKEMKASIPDIETVVVKKAIHRYAAECLTFEKTLPMIREGAKRAMHKAKKVKPFYYKGPAEVELDLHNPYHASVFAKLLPDVRAEKVTVHYTARDSWDIYRFLTLSLYLINSRLFPDW
jgi:D-amino peptidase